MLCSKGKKKSSTYNSQLDIALRYGSVQLDITVCYVANGKGKFLHKTGICILRYGTEQYKWISRYVV